MIDVSHLERWIGEGLEFNFKTSKVNVKLWNLAKETAFEYLKLLIYLLVVKISNEESPQIGDIFIC